MTRVVHRTMAIVCAASLMGITSARNISAQTVPLDSASAIATLRSVCGVDAPGRGVGMLRGEVRGADTLPVGSAAVTIAWLRPAEAQPGASRAGTMTDAPVLAGLSDAQGHWYICGAPLHNALTVRAVADDGADERIVTLDAANPVAAVDFALHPVAPGSDAGHPARTTALVVLSVEDKLGHALAGVTLDITPAHGAARRVVTDSSGSAIVAAVEPGRARVNSLGIGYRPGELFVPLEVGRNTVPLVLDEARLPTLATIRVIGDREVLARHQEFEMRRSLGQTTASITAADIEKRNPTDTWQMLTNISAMRVMEYGSGPGVFAMSTRERPVVLNRGAQGGGATTTPCWYRVMIDGVMLPDRMPDLSSVLPAPGDVHGLEVFAGLATIPPQYNSMIADGQGGAMSNSCGLIVVWTK